MKKLLVLFMLLALATSAEGAARRRGAIGVAASPGTLITTINFANPNGSATASNFITNEAGLAFQSCTVNPSACVANGCTTGAPQFFVHNTTTAIAFSESVQPICYSDGSLWWASFIFRDPTAIAANASQTVDIKTGGAYPSASARTLSDFAAGGLDLNTQVVGLDNLSGTYNCDLNQGVTANSTSGAVKQGFGYHYLTGAVGEVWRIQADYQTGSTPGSGTPHGQLECWWYVAALQDNSGNLAGIRYLVRTTAPWYNVNSPAGTNWSFSSYGDYNSTTLIQNNWPSPYGSGYNFTWPGNTGHVFNVTGIPWESGALIRLTTTGSLPGGLATGTSYFVSNGGTGAAGFGYSTTTFSIGTIAPSVVSGNSLITPTCTPSCGSGTFTATAYPWLSQFGSLYDAQPNGTWNYIQGAGSIASDSGVRVVPNQLYTRSAHVIPPLCFMNLESCSSCPTCTSAVEYGKTYTFFPQTEGPLFRSFEATGGRGDLGPITQWGGIYWQNQTAADEQNLRVIGLGPGQLPMNLRYFGTAACFNSTVCTGSLPVVNHTNYNNMPTFNSAFEWFGSTAGTNGFTTPANHNALIAGFDEFTASHIPDFDFEVFLVTGEPEYMDMLLELGLGAVYNNSGAAATAASIGSVTSIHGTLGPSGRNYSIGGTPYYSGTTATIGNLLRTDAWSTRNVGFALWASQADPENPSYHTYLNDLETANSNAVTAYMALFNSSNCNWSTSPFCQYVFQNGVWNEEWTNVYGGVYAPWAAGYLLNSYDYVDELIPGDSNLASIISWLVLWDAHVHSSFGTTYISAFHDILRVYPGKATSTPPAADTGVAFEANSLALTWTSGNATFTQSGGPSPANSYVPANGDRFMFNSQDSGEAAAKFTGTVTGTALNVSAGTQPSIGQSIFNNESGGNDIATIPNGTYIVSGTAPNWTLNNSFSSASVPIMSGIVPAGFQGETSYYACNVSGHTLQLSTTTGAGCGSNVITPAGSGSNVNVLVYAPGITTRLVNGVLAQGADYMGYHLSGFQWAEANGISVDTTVITDEQTFIQQNYDGNYPSGYTQFPIYLMKPSY